ncbi:ATP-binding cassette domain-containing protein [Sphingomonas sp. HITSZ_GF]|uniref:ATP-binding cassette domain-containing protein n=1 Tax=Sphingomonas sp. HITSZ_GF TaxID=3037247 RepID=UPI00240E8521|nr:ATP-binding cassette domain-containing protein [Sphingomonas sp. HITSZ_GF]MDG2533052.1 ATP-binding cassette domain-containing protein [Sphingomonas sp. HITSZ_GF]
MGYLEPQTLRAVDAEAPMNGAAILSAQGLTCRYGHVTALDGVELELRAGQVTALLGDNGAGKSTLISLLSGVNRPSEGEIRIDGTPVRIGSPDQARAVGIATVFQTLALVEDRSIAENLFLGREPVRFGFLLDRGRMHREAAAVFERLQVKLPPVGTAVRYLSGGQRQAIAVARTMLDGARVVILDEPTAALGVRETGKVLDLIRQLRAAGAAVLLVSHNMENVFDVADRAVVLRLGRKVADLDLAGVSRAELVRHIVGAEHGA